MAGLSIVTVNVRGLKNKKKRHCVFNFVKKGKYDVVALQECHITSEQEATQWELQWGGKLYYTSGTARSLGQTLLVNKKHMQHSELIYQESRILVIKIKVEDRNIMIMNIYAPNNNVEKIEFFNHVTEVTQNLTRDNPDLIIMGDFNSVIDNKDDIISGNKHNNREVDAFNDLVAHTDIHDIWRYQHENIREYTWNRTNPFTARRLDYIFASSSLLCFTEKSEILSFPFSDHRLVHVSFKMHHFQRGPSYWKFNNSLLKDAQYTEMINNILQEEEQGSELNPHHKWDMTKIKIKECTIEYSKRKAQNSKTRCLILTTRLNEIEKDLSEEPNKENSVQEMIKIKKELELAHLTKVQGAQTRSRTKFIEEGEKNTAYFYALERTKSSNNTITSLTTEDGKVLHEQSEILKEQVNFYSNLYKENSTLHNTQETYIEDFLATDNEHPVLDDSEQALCEGEITEQEVAEALRSMKNGSAPGSDGLTTEFYKFFWSKLKKILIASFKHSREIGQVSTTQKRGIITLTHKGKDLPRDHLTNWRPITLLNSDYKIIAKTMALRLNNVICKIINTDQCGFIKGRNIATILRSTDDIINYLNSKNLPGLLVAVDFAKAFDTISKKLILDTLKEFNFGPEFTQWVRTLISQTESCINHYGWLSEPINIERGIRQGCPLSPLIFVLAVEILAIKVRNSSIKGINIRQAQNETTFKIQQYADDTTLFLKDKEDLDMALHIFNNFTSISGLNISHNKTEAMWLGIDRNRNDKYHNLAWVSRTKILGVYFQNDKVASELEINWKGRIENTKRVIAQWHRRNLSIMGKINIVKSLLISQFIFIMQAIGLSEKVLNNINHIIFTFIWKRKNSNKKAFEKVKRKVMCQELEEGGLKMIDAKTLQSALYLGWIPKLLSTKQDKWKSFPTLYLSKLAEGMSILHTPCHPKDIIGYPKTHGLFWKKVLENWLLLRIKENHNIQQVTPSSSIWNNANFQYKKKNLHMKDWITAGIFKIRHIINENGEMLSIQEIRNMVGNSASRQLEYNAVCSTLEATRRHNQLNLEVNEEESIDHISLAGKPICVYTVKDFRKLLSSSSLPCAVNFWKNKLNTEIDQKYWLATMEASKEVRLRVLQWKILHNIYPTNILLKKMGLTQSENCSACSSGDKDYIEHFFFNCKAIQPIWNQVEEEIKIKTSQSIKICLKTALLGYQNPEITSRDKQIRNHLITIAKMWISKFRY